MNRLLLIITTFILTAVAQAETKIGYIDMQKAIQGTSAGKKASKELETEFNKKEKEFEKIEVDLKKMGEDLEKKKSVLSEEALNKKQAEFQQEMLKYREMVNKGQMEIQKKGSDLSAPIIEKMKTVIAKLAKDKGYSMVLENSQLVLYATAECDLTDAVTKAFESEK
ncbi:MAG: OmpH family outer membrane protein [Bdellovibrio sp.]